MGVSVCSVRDHADEQADAHGEVVWSWHPDADAKFALPIDERADDGGKNAGPRGEYV